MDDLMNNHKLHGLALGIGVYYLMNKQGSDKALKFGVVFGIGSALYMDRYGHTTDGFREIQTLLGGKSTENVETLNFSGVSKDFTNDPIRNLNEQLKTL